MDNSLCIYSVALVQITIFFILTFAGVLIQGISYNEIPG